MCFSFCSLVLLLKTAEIHPKLNTYNSFVIDLSLLSRYIKYFAESIALCKKKFSLTVVFITLRNEKMIIIMNAFSICNNVFLKYQRIKNHNQA